MIRTKRFNPYGTGFQRRVPGSPVLPGDLQPKRVFTGEGGMITQEILDQGAERGAADRKYLGNAIYVSRSLVGRAVTVGTTPVLLIREPMEMPHFILNPSTSVGLTTTVTGAAGNFLHNGVTASFGVSGFETCHLHIVVTGVTPGDSWTINMESFDSISGTWITSQVVAAAVIGAISTYAYPGAFGMATDVRFQFVEAAAGINPITLSIGVTMKLGAGGSSAGLAQVVYLGGEGVSTVSGFPLLEGRSQVFIVGENVELWGVAPNNINVRIFTM